MDALTYAACDDFTRLPTRDRDRIRAAMQMCERIGAHPGGVLRGIEAEAQIISLANPRGGSRGSIKRLYYAWKNTGDWRVFMRKGSVEKKAASLPLQFIDYWHGIVLNNKRKTKPAHRQLCKMWFDGLAIPGYGTWQDYWAKRIGHAPDVCPPDLPHGWSYEALNRIKPAAADISLARYGIASTRHMLPHVIGTREGLRPLEYIAFDDVELDFLVYVTGVQRPCKIRALVCKDVATDCWLRFVLRPAILRDDGVQDGLKLKDMKRLVGDLGVNFGFPMDYVSNWIMERGTATLPGGEIIALSESTGGMVKVHLTSMISGKVLMGGYADKSVGNSWGKAWIESGFNLVHNELAHLPGQKGRRYDLAPAELEARKKSAIALMRAGEALPLDLRQQMRLPFVSIYQAHDQLRDALMRINLMEGHKCEGFQSTLKWRLGKGDQWREYAEMLNLPPEMMDRVMTKQVVETRFERWTRLTQGVTFQKMSPAWCARWYDDHREVSVENHQIKFQHDGRTFVYFHRDSALLSEGSKYLAHFNPFDMDVIYLTTGDGAYRGTLPRVKAVQRGDQEALEKRLADTRHILNGHLASVRNAQKQIDEQSLADMEHNIALFQKSASTPIIDLTAAIAAREAERAQDASRRNAARHLDAADLLDAPAADPADDAAEPIKFDPSMLLD